METARKRCGAGRRRVAMEQIKNRDKLYSCFSKRRRGIFKKAGQLATLCGVQIAVVTLSTGGKYFSFGHPSAEAVIDRYLDVPLTHVPETFDAPLSCLERKPGEPPGGRFWWVDSIHVLERGDLEEIDSMGEKIRRATLKKADVLASARERTRGQWFSDRVPDRYVRSWGGN